MRRQRSARWRRAIAQYERCLGQARADLSHVNACIALFEVSGKPGAVPPYVDTHRLFARGELMKLCKEALASGPKTTKELALHVMATKGLDTGKKVLAHAMATRHIHALRQQWRRGLISGDGKVKGAWCGRFASDVGNAASLVRHQSPMFARACVAYRLGLVCGRCPPQHSPVQRRVLGRA